MRVKSAFPPICFESPITGKKYIVCTGGKESSGWVEVKRPNVPSLYRTPDKGGVYFLDHAVRDQKMSEAHLTAG